jgi:hypothetical protein
MLSRIKDMAQKLPPLIGQIVCFGTLVGPRATELLECVKLIEDNQTFQKYYDPEHMILCHYKFSDIFIRRIKKIIFLSFETPSMLAAVNGRSVLYSSRKITYSAIRQACNRIWA